MAPYYSAQSYKACASIGYLVRRARSLMIAHIETAFAPHEITFMQWVVLMQLRDELHQTAREISRDLRHDSGALTRLIDQLTQRGLIERRRRDEDRRVLTLKLTDSGRGLVESLIPTVVDVLNEELQGFTHQELDTLTTLLARLTANLATFSNRPHLTVELES